MAGNYVRGAFISFIPQFLAPVPNVIVFQFNPEKMTHDWQESKVEVTDETPALSVAGNPEESFSFKLVLDSLDVIADRLATAPIAQASGVYSRLAALETLRFPIEKNGGWQLPLVLFTWGPGRIVPVRITKLSITETLYDQFLNPVQAEVDLDLDVLSREEIDVLPKSARRIANAATIYSTRLRQGLAVANLANAVEGTIGMLPF